MDGGQQALHRERVTVQIIQGCRRRGGGDLDHAAGTLLSPWSLGPTGASWRKHLPGSRCQSRTRLTEPKGRLTVADACRRHGAAVWGHTSAISHHRWRLGAQSRRGRGVSRNSLAASGTARSSNTGRERAGLLINVGLVGSRWGRSSAGARLGRPSVPIYRTEQQSRIPDGRGVYTVRRPGFLITDDLSRLCPMSMLMPMAPVPSFYKELPEPVCFFPSLVASADLMQQ